MKGSISDEQRGNPMKCVNCGAHIKDGSVYCPVCGKEAQVINGYTSLEDDLLHSLLREGVENETGQLPSGKKRLSKEERLRIQKRKQQRPILATCAILVVCILIGIGIKIYVDYKNDNSYEYQMEMAASEVIDHNYEVALKYYARALAIHPTDIACRMEMVEIDMLRLDYDAAIVLLQEVIQLDESYEKAYELLIDIYKERKQYDQIRNLAKLTKDHGILELFEGYLIEGPVLYPEGGKHKTAITITMVSVADEPIYYTLDGMDPTKDGILYVQGIKLNQTGEYIIRAVCKNIESGVYSEEVKKKYSLSIEPPDAPRTTPEGGTVFSELTYVTLYAEEDCSIYYTWDGSTPTIESEKYSMPVLIPEGEHILSAIAVNEHTGLVSAVMQERFTYVITME